MKNRLFAPDSNTNIKKIRPEKFGAIVSIHDPPALVYVDRPLAKKLGVPSNGWKNDLISLSECNQFSAPTEVHVSTTDRCPAGCQTCYMDATPNGYEPSLSDLKKRLKKLSGIGVFNVALGGGESTMRQDLFDIAAYAVDYGLSVSVTTSGQGVHKKNASKFQIFSQVNVSYDGLGDTYQKVRGYDGAGAAEKSIQLLLSHGVNVGANVVLTRQNFGQLRSVFKRLEEIGVKEVQLLRLKPAGRAQMDYLSQRLTSEQVQSFPAILSNAVNQFSFGLRIDCSMVPFMAYGNYFNSDSLIHFGVMGCEAGRSLMTLDSRGGAHPCSFWKESKNSNAYFQDDLDADEAWEKDSTLASFREHHTGLKEPCNTCEFKHACRGGCQVVTRFYSKGDWGPDPECPRVIAFRQKG